MDILLNYTKGRPYETTSERAFPEGVPANDIDLKRQLETFFDLSSGSLDGFVVTPDAYARRERNTSNERILIRPEATFGEEVDEEDTCFTTSLDELMDDIAQDLARSRNLDITIDLGLDFGEIGSLMILATFLAIVYTLVSHSLAAGR